MFPNHPSTPRAACHTPGKSLPTEFICIFNNFYPKKPIFPVLEDKILKGIYAREIATHWIHVYFTMFNSKNPPSTNFHQLYSILVYNIFKIEKMTE